MKRMLSRVDPVIKARWPLIRVKFLRWNIQTRPGGMEPKFLEIVNVFNISANLPQADTL